MILDNIVDFVFLVPVALMAVLIVVMMIVMVVGVISGICGNESLLSFGVKNFQTDVPAFNAVNVSFFLLIIAAFVHYLDWLSTTYISYFFAVFSVSCLWYLIYSVDVWYTNILEYIHKTDVAKLKEKK